MPPKDHDPSLAHFCPAKGVPKLTSRATVESRYEQSPKAVRRWDLQLGVLLPLHPIHGSDHHKQDPGDDEEVDRDGEEPSIAHHRSRLLGVPVGKTRLHLVRECEVV